MSPILKGAIVFGTIVGTGGTTYGIYNAMQPTPEKTKTYSEVFKDTLLPTSGDQHDQNWKDRLTSLQSVNSEDKLVQALKALKTKSGDDQWKTLRDWCKDTIKQSTKAKEDLEFQNIQNYCTYSIKEKITSAIAESSGEGDAKWLTGHKKLAEIAVGDLDDELKLAKQKSEDQEKKKVIKDWCTKAYKKPYKGNNDKDFKNASIICKES